MHKGFMHIYKHYLYCLIGIDIHYQSKFWQRKTLYTSSFLPYWRISSSRPKILGIRFPRQNNNTERAGPSVVRRSVGEIEARNKTLPKTQANPVSSQLPFEIKVTNKTNATTEATVTSPKQPVTYKNRTAEAKACLGKAKLQLNNSRNLHCEIKSNVLNAIEHL